MPYIGNFKPKPAILDADDIADDAITSAKLADNAVVTAAINADAVTSAKIADNAVVTAAINADAVTAAKIGADQIGNSELNLGANYAFTGTVTGAGIDGKPAFHAYLNTQVTGIAHNTVTIIPMAHERFDTNSAYNTSTYKFTPQVAGTYQFGVAANMQMGNGKYLYVYVLKNGTGWQQAVLRVVQTYGSEDYAGIYCSGPVVMNGSSDWVTPACYHNHGSDRILQAHTDATLFWGFRIY